MDETTVTFIRPVTLTLDQSALVFLALTGQLPIHNGVLFVPHHRAAEYASLLAALKASTEPLVAPTSSAAGLPDKTDQGDDHCHSYDFDTTGRIDIHETAEY